MAAKKKAEAKEPKVETPKAPKPLPETLPPDLPTNARSHPPE